jgi:transcriptional regulator with XRE-family HTH domain/mannose-6-phosphate isomerase-like protein (cupin superfamily)
MGAPADQVPPDAGDSSAARRAATNGALADRREAVSGVGARLRTHREAAKLSLRQFARDLGVSPSFVSQLENGKSQPSVATLYMICSALGLSIDQLFSEVDSGQATVPPAEQSTAASSPAAGRKSAPDSLETSLSRLRSTPADGDSPVVTVADRRRLELDSGVTWEQLSSAHEAAVDFMFVRYDVGGSSTPDERVTRHSGTEYGYVLRGTLQVTLGFESYEMKPGDSISFDSSTPHRLANVGDIPVEGVWFVHGRNASHEH